MDEDSDDEVVTPPRKTKPKRKKKANKVPVTKGDTAYYDAARAADSDDSLVDVSLDDTPATLQVGSIDGNGFTNADEVGKGIGPGPPRHGGETEEATEEGF